MPPASPSTVTSHVTVHVTSHVTSHVTVHGFTIFGKRAKTGNTLFGSGKVKQVSKRYK